MQCIRGDLLAFSHLRTLRLAWDMQSLPTPSSLLQTLHIDSPHRIEAYGLHAVARKFTKLREVSLKGIWAPIPREEWSTFVASMPRLMVFHMRYTLRKPPNETIIGAVEAFSGRRLVLEE